MLYLLWPFQKRAWPKDNLVGDFAVGIPREKCWHGVSSGRLLPYGIAGEVLQSGNALKIIDQLMLSKNLFLLLYHPAVMLLQIKAR